MSASLPPSFRSRVGFAGLLASVVIAVTAKAELGGGDSASQAAAPRTTVPSTAGPSPAPSASSGSGSSSSGSGSTSSGSTSSGSGSSTSGTRTVTGDTIDTRFGPVQVQVTLSGSKITDVQAVQLPTQERRDLEINDYAVPQLRQEVLSAQSASIDTISGASFTSEAYAQSVQSALDRARS